MKLAWTLYSTCYRYLLLWEIVVLNGALGAFDTGFWHASIYSLSSNRPWIYSNEWFIGTLSRAQSSEFMCGEMISEKSVHVRRVDLPETYHMQCSAGNFWGYRITKSRSRTTYMKKHKKLEFTGNSGLWISLHAYCKHLSALCYEETVLKCL